LTLFRNFVKENRPQLDMAKVATGETWFGKDALDRGLCDELKTVDEVLMEFVDKGYDVYEVEYSPPKEPLKGLGGLFQQTGSTRSGGDSSSGSLVRRGIQWLVRTVASEVQAELEQQSRMVGGQQEQRYMVKDDWSERVRVQEDDYYN
jgi:ClpP class serine protease